jgi:hypothetical protein
LQHGRASFQSAPGLAEFKCGIKAARLQVQELASGDRSAQA